MLPAWMLRAVIMIPSSIVWAWSEAGTTPTRAQRQSVLIFERQTIRGASVDGNNVELLAAGHEAHTDGAGSPVPSVRVLTWLWGSGWRDAARLARDALPASVAVDEDVGEPVRAAD